MRGWIRALFAPIVIASEFDAVLIDDHAADWHVGVKRSEIGLQ